MKGIKKKLLSIFLAMAMVFSSIPGSVVPFGVTVYAEDYKIGTIHGGEYKYFNDTEACGEDHWFNGDEWIAECWKGISKYDIFCKDTFFEIYGDGHIFVNGSEVTYDGDEDGYYYTTDADYQVANVSGENLYLVEPGKIPAHEHSYELEPVNGNTVTAKCSTPECDKDTITLSIKASNGEKNVAYNGAKLEGDVATFKESFTVSEISYTDKNGTTVASPTEAGEYFAVVSVNSNELKKSFKIEEPDPSFTDGMKYHPKDHEIGGSPSEPNGWYCTEYTGIHKYDAVEKGIKIKNAGTFLPYGKMSIKYDGVAVTEQDLENGVWTVPHNSVITRMEKIEGVSYLELETYEPGPFDLYKKVDTVQELFDAIRAGGNVVMMEDMEIHNRNAFSNTNASSYGGNIMVEVTKPAVLDLNGHTLSLGTEANYAGRLFNITTSGASLTLQSSNGEGKISGFYNSSSNGGLIYLSSSNASFTLKENVTINAISVAGKQNSNVATKAVVWVSFGTFTMEGGKISDYLVGQENGAVYVNNSSSAKFIMTGGEISGNYSIEKRPSDVYHGTGVYVAGTNSKVTIGGTAKITGNHIDHEESGKPSTTRAANLYLPTGAKINVGTGTSAPVSGMSVGVLMQTPGVFTTATSEANKAYFTSNNKDYEVTFNTDNALMLSEVEKEKIDSNYTLEITTSFENGKRVEEVISSLEAVLKDKDGNVVPTSLTDDSEGPAIVSYEIIDLDSFDMHMAHQYRDWRNYAINFSVYPGEGYIFDGDLEDSTGVLPSLIVKFNETELPNSYIDSKDPVNGYIGRWCRTDTEALYTTIFILATGDAPESPVYADDIYDLINGNVKKLFVDGTGDSLDKYLIDLEYYMEDNDEKPYSSIYFLRDALIGEGCTYSLASNGNTYTVQYKKGEDVVMTISLTADDEGDVTKVTFDDDAYGLMSEEGAVTFSIPHSHGGWSYSASGDTVTATCAVENCNLNGSKALFIIAAPENAKYDGTTPFSAIVDSENNTTFKTLNDATVGDIEYVGVAPTTYNKTTTAPKAAGTYKASVVVTINGTPYTAEVEFTIDKVDPTASDFTYSAPSDLVYNGQAKTATVVAKDTASQVTVKYYKDTKEVTDPTDAGTYTVKITATAGNNHVATTEEITVGTFTITKAAPVQNNFTYSAPSDLVYNGQAKTASVVAAKGVTGLGTIAIKYYNGATKVTDPTDAGTYTVKVTTAEGDNYLAATEEITVGTFTITVKTLDNTTITLSPGNREFTGIAVTQTVTVKDGEKTLVAGTDYDVSTTGLSGTALGDYVITVTFKGNYSGTPTKTWSIVKAASTLTTAPTAKNNLVYDGTAKTLVTAGSGVTGGTLKYSLDGETYSETVPSAKDAGEYTVWYKVCGDSDHSDTEPASVSVTIAKKPITVSGIKVVEKTYNGNMSATLNYADVTFTGLLSGEELAVEAVGTFAEKNVAADKTVNIRGITLKDVTDKDYLKNYVLAAEGQQTTATGTIKPKDIEVAITTNGGTFAGEISPATATSTGYVEGDNAPELTLTYYTDSACTTKTSTTDGATAAGGMPTKAGTYYVKATVKSDVNYIVKDTTENPQTKTFVVAKATLDETSVNVVMSDVLFTKDDEKTHEVTVSVTYNGQQLVEGDDFVVNGYTGKEVGKYTLTIEGKGDFKGTVTRNWAINEVKTKTQKVTLDESNGSLTVTVTGDESAPNVSVNNLKEVLTSAELAAVKNGGMDIDVIVTVKAIQAEDVDADSLAKIEKVSDKTENIRYLDITVDKVIKTLKNSQVIDMKTVSITKTESGLKFTIDVPSTIPAVEQGYNRVYTVIRSHKENGVYTAEKLVTTYEAGKLSFTTDKFSDYALMYVDSKIPTNSEETKPSVSTSNVNTSYKAPNTGVNN